MTAARRLGRYTIGEKIGVGGLAEVFVASVEGAAGFRKQVVVKRLRPDLADEPGAGELLTAEAAIAERLNHGNIVQVLDYGEQPAGSPYLVLEHIDGCSLRELLDDLDERGEPLPLSCAVFIVEEVCAALQYVHDATDQDGGSLHLVHRDATPNNILISRDGVVKLTDFGIAKVRGAAPTIPGLVKGTPLYVPPEQATGRPVDRRADIYTLGLVLGEMLADPRDSTLAEIVDRATQPAPADRFASMAEFRASLAQWHGGAVRTSPQQLARMVVARSGGRVNRRRISLDDALADLPSQDLPLKASPPAPSRRRTAVLLGALALVIVSGGGLWWWNAAATSNQARPTQPRPHVAASADIIDQTQPKPSLAAPKRTGDATDGPPVGGAELSGPPEVADPSAPAATGPAAQTLSAQPADEAPADGLAGDPTQGASRPKLTRPLPTRTKPASRPTRPPKPEPKPRPAPVRLKVNLLPYAYVKLDGKVLGRTPIDITVSAGRHVLELNNPDTHQYKRRQLVIRKDQPVSIKEW